MSNYVVSISREFGSGGRLIGKKLAASLGIPCYDRTLIQKTAEKSGLSPDFIARAEERARSRFHLNIAPIGIGVPTFTHQGIPVSHQAFFAQADVIRELAAEGEFVICLYNPSSKARGDCLAMACDRLLARCGGERICGIVRNIGRQGQEYRVMTLRELRDWKADMFTTVFVGNSQTRRIGDYMVTPRGYRHGQRG